MAEHPLAKVDPAPIHGLPSPTFLLSIDYSTGAGGFSGPATDVIVPSVGQLEPISYASSDGNKAGTVSMASTLHAGWQIVPARGGGPEVIETVDCEPDGKKQDRQTYRSIRFVDGQWRASARQKGECGEIEVMPPRSMFP